LKEYKETYKDKPVDLSHGLGSQVGTEEWLSRKTKQFKMNEFAVQVSELNKNKIKILDESSNSKKSNALALEYQDKDNDKEDKN